MAQDELVVYTWQLFQKPAAAASVRWIEGLRSSGAASTGISNTAAFVIPGVASTSVEDVQQQVDQLAQNEPQIPGAFLWPANADFSNVDFSSATTQFPLQKYAEAIRDGLASGRSYPNG